MSFAVGSKPESERLSSERPHGSLSGKVCLVTGGASGIGRATALEMSSRGASIAIGDRDEASGLNVVEEIRQLGGTAVFQRADLRSMQDISELMDAVLAAYGRVDVLHNNAGIHETDLTNDATIDALPEDVWDAVFDINVKAMWRLSRLAAAHMRTHGGGAIVNASSSGGLVGYPMGAAYCSSKGAVIQLTKVMAIEWAPFDIRVNCYCPAAIDTRMIQRYLDSATDRAAIERTLVGSHLIKRLGQPEEVARLVCFLASDDASFITGSSYVIDGGSLAWRGVD